MASFRTRGTRNKNRRKNSQRQWFRRLLSLLLLFCFGLFTVVCSVPAPAQVVNPYNIRFQTNATGDIRFVSNTIATCSLLDISSSRTDVNGGNVAAGDLIDYTFTVKNTSSTTATNVILRNPIPTNMTYVAGTLNITAGANSGAKTDATGDDQADFSSGQITFRLGTSANAAFGGSLAANDTTTISYRLQVKAGASGAIDNFATVSYDENGVTFSPVARRTITVASNTTSNSDTSTTNCSTARQGDGQNNSFPLLFIDVDNDTSTFNSSSADLSLPSGSTVQFAGLYWAGSSTNAARNQVRFATRASGGYIPVPATTLYIGTGFGGGTNYTESYQGFADVTAQVKAGGNGTYTVANVQTTNSVINRWGGWSLVVVYSNPSERPRNLTVFDGYSNVSTTNPLVSMDISGFITPPFGTVKAKLGTIVYDGDRGTGYTGDNLNFRSPPTAATGTNITNAVNPNNDVFNSTISYLGTYVTTKNPNYVNQLGYDADIFDASGIIRNGDTSARITVNTSSESYIPGVITSAIDLYKPTVATNKIYSDINGGNVEAGDVLEYTLTITNNRDTDGNGDPANNNVLIDPIPANTTYLSNSIQITDGANLGAKTDAQDADQAEFDAANNRVVFRLGAGAKGYSAGNYPYVDYTPASPNTNGGTLSVNTNSSGSPTVGSTTTVKFRVTINSGTATGTKITNEATEFNTGQTLGQGVALAAASPTVTASVANNPNVLLVKRITAVNQVNYTDLVDGVNDTNSPNYVPAPRDADDNNSNWSTGYLQGRINGGKVRPGDELEYTIYFLSAGKATAPTVLMCDRVPDNTTFIPTTFNSSPAQATGGISGADRGIVLSYNGSTVSLTSVQDGDAAQYFPAGVDPKTVYPKIDCGGTNTNGAVVVNLGNLPNATGSGTPTGSYGFVRFRSRMK